MAKQPHIIIFNPDEMRGDALAHLGNPASITPNLDAFAANEAVSFGQAYCQNPVCVPSRCSFFTGLYPHVRGHRTMSHLLRPGETSMLKELKEAGYYVWMNDRNDLTAGQIPGWTESHATEIYYSGQKKQGPGNVNPDQRGEPGNKYYYSHYEGQLKCNAEGKNYNGDDEVVDAAIERIHNRPADQPLCMFLGLVYPHTPYRVEEPYFSAIDRAKLPKRVHADDCTGKPLMEAEIRKYAGMQDFNDADWDELRAVYLGMCMKIDVQFGKLVEALKEEGIYDDCAIFFLSDHGDFTGDFDLPEKAQNCFEDCLTRVPLLIKPPKNIPLDPGISNSMVELVDFYATAMDLAGVQPTHTHFGHSLRPVLADRSAKVRDYVFCEGGRQPGETHCDEYHRNSKNGKGAPTTTVYWPKMKAQSEDDAHAKGIMMRDERYKYISRTVGKDELYDLQADPQEMTNRIDDESLAPVVVDMQRKMLKWLEATDDIVPFELDERFTPEMLWARVRGLVPPEKEAEVRKMIADGTPFPVLMVSANLSTRSILLPLTAAAMPKVPGQVASTPPASFIPNTSSPFSLRELDAAATGIKCSHSSHTASAWFIQSAKSAGVALARRITWRLNQSLSRGEVPGKYCSPKIVLPRNSPSSRMPVSSVFFSISLYRSAMGPVMGYLAIRQSEMNSWAIFSFTLNVLT